MHEFLTSHARDHYETHLDAARKIQQRLKSGYDGFVPQVLAGWHTVGIHPAQEDTWEQPASDQTDPMVKTLKNLRRPN